jgi:hypothetical protein
MNLRSAGGIHGMAQTIAGVAAFRLMPPLCRLWVSWRQTQDGLHHGKAKNSIALYRSASLLSPATSVRPKNDIRASVDKGNILTNDVGGRPFLVPSPVQDFLA